MCRGFAGGRDDGRGAVETAALDVLDGPVDQDTVARHQRMRLEDRSLVLVTLIADRARQSFDLARGRRRSCPKPGDLGRHLVGLDLARGWQYGPVDNRPWPDGDARRRRDANDRWPD